MKHRIFYCFITIPLMVFLAGCTVKPIAISYYQIKPKAETVTTTISPANQQAIGIGPVSLPEMLKRQEIVISVEGNRYHLMDKHRWAGLLEKDISIALSENISTLLGSNMVVNYPWPSYIKPRYQVVLELLELTGKPGEKVILQANWTIVDRNAKDNLIRESSQIIIDTENDTINALVDAENQALLELSQRISKTITTIK
jgi:uncharacterized protein